MVRSGLYLGVRLVRRTVRLIKYRRKNISIARGSFIDMKANIGEGTRINAPSHIGECIIGKYCACGGRLVVRSSDHYMQFLNMQDYLQKNIIGSNLRVAGKEKTGVTIGNAVWIGDSVIVLPGGSIGDGAVVGAGSVVTKPIPSYAIAVGNPAKVIKMRFSTEIVEIIKGLEWWNWTKRRMRRNKWLFELNLTAITPDELRRYIRENMVSER